MTLWLKNPVLSLRNIGLQMQLCLNRQSQAVVKDRRRRARSESLVDSVSGLSCLRGNFLRIASRKVFLLATFLECSVRCGDVTRQL